MAETENTEKEQAVATSSTFISQIAKKIDECDNILVTLSRNPSVDEMTAALGLTIFLDKLGKHATAIYSGRTPNVLQFLKPEETFETNTNSLQDFIVALNKDKADHLRYSIDGDYVKIFITPYKTTIEESDLEFSHGDYNVDLIIALNVPTVNDLDAALTEHGRIMHDASAIDITTGQPGKFGEIEWSDPAASSVSEMAADLILSIQNVKSPMSQASATAFLAGIIAETKRFSNEKTTPKTMNIASELMKLGADQQVISSHLAESDAPAAVAATMPEEATDADPTRLNVQHDQIQGEEQPAAPTAQTTAPTDEVAPLTPSTPPASSPEAATHGKPNLTPSPEMEAQAQTPPEPEFVAVSQPPTPMQPPVPMQAPAPQPAPAMPATPVPAPAPTPAAPTAMPEPIVTPELTPTMFETQPQPMPQPPAEEPNMLPPEPVLSGAVDLPPMTEPATTSAAIPNETSPFGAMGDASMIAPDKKPLDVPAPNEKDYGKMIDEALAETTLQGDAPIEPTQPLVTNMAAAAAPPVMEQPEANSVPEIAYDQAPVAAEQSAPQPVPIPNMETLPPPPPPPIPQIPEDPAQAQPMPQPMPAPEMQPAPEAQPQPTPAPAATPEVQPQPTTETAPATPATDSSTEEMPAPTLTPDMFQIPGA